MIASRAGWCATLLAALTSYAYVVLRHQHKTPARLTMPA